MTEIRHTTFVLLSLLGLILVFFSAVCRNISSQQKYAFHLMLAIIKLSEQCLQEAFSFNRWRNWGHPWSYRFTRI